MASNVPKTPGQSYILVFVERKEGQGGIFAPGGRKKGGKMDGGRGLHHRFNATLESRSDVP